MKNPKSLKNLREILQKCRDYDRPPYDDYDLSLGEAHRAIKALIKAELGKNKWKGDRIEGLNSDGRAHNLGVDTCINTIDNLE